MNVIIVRDRMFKNIKGVYKTVEVAREKIRETYCEDNDDLTTNDEKEEYIDDLFYFDKFNVEV